MLPNTPGAYQIDPTTIVETAAKKLTLLNVAHEFVTIMVMALIIGFMGV